MGARFRDAAAGAALVLLGVSLAGCTSGDGAPVTAAGDTSVPGDLATYDAPGPHSVEQLTVTVDGPEGPNEVRVWAPTDGTGPWPLLVYAHGLGLSASDHDRELSHAASWGFVTAAHERTKDVDLVELAGAVLDLAERSSSPLEGLVGADEALVVGGMSQGSGYAAATAAASPDDVAGVLLVSGGGAPASGGTGNGPTLVLAGGRDPALPTWIEPGFDAAQGPATMIVVEDAGHGSFSTICASAERRSMAGANPRDCAAEGIDEQALWPAIDHSIVAFLRWATGQDRSAAALSEPVIDSLGADVTVRGDLDAG